MSIVELIESALPCLVLASILDLGEDCGLLKSCVCGFAAGFGELRGDSAPVGEPENGAWAIWGDGTAEPASDPNLLGGIISSVPFA